MKVRSFGTTLAACGMFLAFGGCSSSPPPGESAKATSEAIQGGTVDSTHTFAVGVCIAGVGTGGKYPCQAFCSGALIAPNLVVTARHCVQHAPEQIDCATSKFGASNGSLSITTDTDMSTATHWHPVRSVAQGGVITPTDTSVCGNDLALLILTSNVPASEATPVTPVGQYMMTDNRYGYLENAIGYGETAAGQGDPGVRHYKGDIDIACIPGDKLRDCGNLQGTQITANEFVTGDGTCGGDSGSSAYNSATFGTAPESFGVLSRGGQDGTTCKNGIYTRLDVWRSLILSTVNTASQLGGYPLPPWTQPAPPSTPKDAGAGEASTSTPGNGAIGDTCSKDTDCKSKSCLSVDGTNFTCSEACDPAASPTTCPSGYKCVAADNGGDCFADDGSGNNNPASTTTTKSGCSVSANGPTHPVPWKGGVSVLGLALVGLRRRRRR